MLFRDVLQLQPVTKPTLLRHLFALAAAYPAQILSFNKMLGQLQDAGNTTTLANYLRLLETAYLVSEPGWSVSYWRDGDVEVDFVVAHGTRVWALEVKSGRPGKTSGMEAFRRRYPTAKTWLIGVNGVKLEEFFDRVAGEWFR